MHVIVDNSPLVPERTPRACDFTDRLRQLTHDVRMIELAVEASLKPNDDRREAIVMASRKLIGEIEGLADEVLPPMTDEEKAILRDAMKRSDLP